jgi:hypothetical protein
MWCPYFGALCEKMGGECDTVDELSLFIILLFRPFRAFITDDVFNRGLRSALPTVIMFRPFRAIQTVRLPT